MDRERLGKVIADGIEYGLLATWLITAFFWTPHLHDLVKLLWVPFLVGIILLIRPLKVLEYWIAGKPNPRQAEREYDAEMASKAEGNTSFGG